MSQKKVAIIGRPNVGKSTLLNRLAGKKLAIVSDISGVTRDWREAPCTLGDLEFTLIDTAGLEGEEEAEIFRQIHQQTEKIIAAADLILFMIDAREGVVATDQKLADRLRRSPVPVILLANKAETRQGKDNLAEVYRLGMGDPVAFSASQGLGMGELYEALKPYLTSSPFLEEDDGGEDPSFPSDPPLNPGAPLSLAVIGRPNMGKSTLLNRLLGDERFLTGPQPGITRDAIGVDWSYKEWPIHLIDTAGVRRRSRVSGELEKLSLTETFRAIQYAQAVILVLDATSPLDKQDLIMASRVIDEGRVLVLALNKWDQVDPTILEEVQARLRSALSQVKDIPCVPISALYGQNLTELMDTVLHFYQLWTQRLPTAGLNEWLQARITRHPPPIRGGRRLKIKYITQIKTRPPTFVLFTSKSGEMPASYLRFLEKALREDFHLPGIPLRLYVRSSKNPYIA